MAMSITPDEISRVKRFDRRSDRLYLDAMGNAAIGYGHIVPDFNSYAAFPLTRLADGLPANAIEKKNAWDQVLSGKNAEAGRAPVSAAPVLLLNKASIDALLVTDLDLAEQQLATYIPGYLQFPLSAKAALVDMAYVLGTGEFFKNHPALIREVQCGNWSAAAQLCAIAQSGPRRNTEVRQLLEQSGRPLPGYTPFPAGVPAVKSITSQKVTQNNSAMQKAKDTVKAPVHKSGIANQNAKPAAPVAGTQKPANAKQSYSEPATTGKHQPAHTGKTGFQTGAFPPTPCADARNVWGGGGFAPCCGQQNYCGNPGIVAIVAISANVTETAIAAIKAMSDRKR